MRLITRVQNLLSKLDLYIGRRSSIDTILAASQAGASKHSDPSESSGSNLLRSQVESVLAQAEHNKRTTIRHQIACKWQLIDQAEASLNPGDKPHRECPLCMHSGPSAAFRKLESHCIFGGGRLVRHQCPKCDVIFGPDKMMGLTPSQLSEEYEWHYSVYEEGDSTEQELRAFHCLDPRKSGVYLNYGAGSWSRSTQILRQQGWNVFAYEPHASASENSDYLISNAEELAGMRFDGIFSNNVLEHMREPVEEISKLLKLLKNDGKIAHATPCFDYLYEYTRFHLYFYLGNSFSVLGEKCGFRVEEFVVDEEFMCGVISNPQHSQTSTNIKRDHNL